MAGKNPSSGASTRWIETSRGILRITELAPLLGERVLRLQERIETGEFAQSEINEDLIRLLHHEFCGDLVPAWGGQWRKIPVTVGTHCPPLPHLLPLQMRDYTRDLDAQLTSATEEESLPSLLAFAEGRFLTIHPFQDFNGRLVRLWLWEIMRRLRLPPVLLIPEAPSDISLYLQALRDSDQMNFLPLTMIWKSRLAHSAP